MYESEESVFDVCIETRNCFMSREEFKKIKEIEQEET